MSNYTKTTDFASKDTLNPGDPNKIIRGSEFDTEFNNIATASAEKADLISPNFEGDVSVNGNITVPTNATIDGRDVSADGTKLDTVETNADVTDTANVTAAGAVMDSELTNEAAVKALNQGVATTDSPTFAGATLGAVTYAATDGTDGQVLTTDGAGNATFEALPNSLYLNVKDFGATGDGSDQTTALQNAINHASTRGIQTIFFPEGHYKYTTLRFYHDQTNNTAFQGTNLYIGDGADTTFDFGWYIADASDLTVTVEGSVQELNTHYTVSGVGSDTGGTVTFTAGNVPQVPGTSTITRSGSIVDGVATREFFYSGTVVPDASNVSVTVGGVTSTAFTVDIGKRLVVFNVGSEPPVGTNNVVITIQKTVNIASNNRDGRVQLRGTGRLAISDLAGLDKNRTRIYGSVLESTGDGIIIDTDQEFSTPVDARNFVAKDLTFLADNTGQIIRAEKNPGMSFDTCSFKQFNPAGTGLEVRNCWFFTMNQCYVVGQRNINTHYDVLADGSTLEQFDYTFDNPSATSDILVQFNGGALTETTDYTVTMGTTKKVTLTQAGATKIGAEYNLSGNRKIDIQVINTGDGISSQFVGRSFGNFAGLWTITQSLIDSFGNGVHWTGGTVTNLSIRDSAIQNCGNYNIYADAGIIQQMLLDNVYMENQKTQGVSFIKGDGVGTTSASIRTLKMTNCFFLGGGTNPRITGPCIDLDSVEDISIEGMYVFRPRQTFLNVADTKNSQNIAGEIKNSVFTSDSEQTKFLNLEPTIYLLTGILPNVHNCVWPGFESGFYNTTNNILLFDSTVESNFLRQYTDFKGTTGTAKFGFGDTKVVTGITSGPYNIIGSDSRTYYDLTHSIDGGLKVKLPNTGEANDGRLIIIKNNEDSTSKFNYPYINVVNNSDDLTTIAQLSPGQAGLFIMDKQDGNKFKYTGRTFTNDLKMANNHEISFGDGTRDAETTSPAAGTVDLTYTFDSPDSAAQLMVERKLSGEAFVRTFDFTVDLATKTVTLDSATVANEEVKIAKSVNDMRIYHQSSDSTNRIDTIGGLTIDDITYPTADGSANQVLTTDGSGTLSFANVSGVGINAVVDDTTPQLGGDLESNGNDILFADNDKAIFGTGSDLQVYHSGTESWIKDAGTGSLYIDTDGTSVLLTSGNSAKNMVSAVKDGAVTLYNNNTARLATSASGIDVTGTINTVLSVDGTTEDVFITGAVPGFELVESDNGGSRVRYAVNNSEIFQSLYGADTSTFGSTTVQTRKSDGSENQVIYTYDGGSNDYHWWGTRTGGDRLVQIDDTGKFRVRGGDVSFLDNANPTPNEAFFWDASSSRLGLGTTSPAYALSLEGSQAAILIDNTAGSPDQTLMQFQADMGTNDRNFQIKSPITDSGSDPFRFVTGNAFGFEVDGIKVLTLADDKKVGIGTESPDTLLELKGADPVLTIRDSETGVANGNATLRLAESDGGDTLGTHYDVALEGGNLTFGYAEAGGATTERMRIQGSSGNVGINNINPQAPLHVNGDSAYGEAAIFQNYGSATGWARADWVNDQAAGSGIVYRDQAGTFTFRNDNSSGTAMNTQIVAGGSTAGNIVFQKDSTGSGEVGRFDSSGNFGIGTASPSNGKLTLEGVDGASSAGIYFNNTTATNGKSYSLSSGNSGEFMLYDRTSSAYRLSVDSSGNILFGATSTATTSYGAKVLKDNSASEIFAVHRQASDGNLIEFARGGANVGRISADSGDLVIGSSASGHKGVRFGANYIAPVNTSSALEDNTTDLGLPAVRFKDLHLSNSIALSNATTSSFLQVSSNILQFGTSSSDPVAFYANNSEAARFDSSGNLLVGKDSTNFGFEGVVINNNGSAEITKNGGSTLFLNRKTSDGDIASFYKDGSAVGSIGCNNNDPYIARAGGNGFRWYSGAVVPTNDSGATADNAMDLGSSTGRFKNLYLANAAYLDKVIGHDDTNTYISFIGSDITQFVQGGAEAMRIESNGRLLLGTANFGGEGGITLAPDFSNGAPQQVFNRASTTSTSFVMRFRNGGTNVGGISHNSTSTSFPTSSDQRLKDNIVDAPSASNDIDAIQVRSFDWKADGSHQKYGMVAQELQDVAPEAVSEGETEEDMMGVDYSKLVPMLVKEIQSLRARVAQLEGDN